MGPDEPFGVGGEGTNIWEKNVAGDNEENFSFFTPSKRPKTLYNWGEKQFLWLDLVCLKLF